MNLHRPCLSTLAETIQDVIRLWALRTAMFNTRVHVSGLLTRSVDRMPDASLTIDDFSKRVSDIMFEHARTPAYNLQIMMPSGRVKYTRTHSSSRAKE